MDFGIFGYLFIKGLVLSTPADGLRCQVPRGPLLTFDPTRVGKARDAIVGQLGIDGLLDVQRPDQHIVRLEVTVHNPVFVEIAQGKRNLKKIIPKRITV